MDQLEYLANLADIFGAVVVVGGLLFGAMQLRHYQHERSRRVAFELVHSFQSPEFARALRIVLSLEDCHCAEDVRRAGPEYEDAAFLVSLTMENVGLMVFRRIAPLDIVLQLMRGPIVVSWRKLGPWMRQMREDTGRDSVGEWFQWIAEQAERQVSSSSERPAYEAFRNWKP